MKIVFIFICVSVAGLGAGFAHAEEAPHTTERLAAIVSYVVADYPGAVKDGKIIAESEYAEQQNLLGEGARIAASLPAPPKVHEHLLAAYGAVQHAVDSKADESTLATAGRDVHRLLREELGLVLSPTSAPSLDAAKSMYQIACARCHGADGH
ncbi:MAG: hypothetical protein ABI321_02640, partial [Polyangia bacterium]